VSEFGIAIQHVNRKGQTYYLHHRRSKTGVSHYHFSTKAKGGNLVEALPEEYEIYESVPGQVFLRRKKPRMISDIELAVLRHVLDRQLQRPIYKLEEQDAAVIVYLAEVHLGFEGDPLWGLLSPSSEDFRRRRTASANYTAMMRFVLSDSDARLFAVERYCFRGSVDRWIHLAGPDRLAALGERFLPHLGHDSFYELM
jgi:hypothetical protein